MLCFVVVMQSFIMNSHEVFIHIHQGCFAGTGVIVRLPQCQWSKPDGYGKISQCITTTKHSKAKTVCIFLGIYCTSSFSTKRLASVDWADTDARRDENHLSFGIWCDLYYRFYGKFNSLSMSWNQRRFSWFEAMALLCEIRPDGGYSRTTVKYLI